MKSLLRILISAALLLAVLPAITLAVATPAAQADTAPAPTAARNTPLNATSGTITMPSGLVQTATFTGGNGVTTVLNDVDGTVSDDGTTVFDPALDPATPNFSVNTTVPTATTCAVSTPCTGFGTATLSFSQPVTNPTLHVTSLGTSGTSSRAYARLTLASSLNAAGGAGNATVGTVQTGARNLVVNGQTIESNANQTDVTCTNAATSAGCGSVTINGTVTSLTFNLGYTWRSLAAGAVRPATEQWGLIASAEEDLGDAPASYDPTQAAAHTIGGLQLGGSVDADQTAVVNPTTSTAAVAAGADNNGTNGDGADENAFATAPAAIPSSALGQANGYSLNVPVSGVAKSGVVCGWIDFDENGTFDTGERACGSQLAAGATSSTLTWSVPAAAAGGLTYARFRTAYGDQAKLASATGRVDSGEVEDYRVTVAQSDLSCSNIYALQGLTPRNVWQVTPGSGVVSNSGAAFGTLTGVADTANLNALGISDTGREIFGIAPSAADPATRLVFRYDRSTGTATQIGSTSIPTATVGVVTHGAVNPRTGVYYYGGINGTTLSLYGFNTLTNTDLGLVGTGTLAAAPGGNGDLAFDDQGNLFVVSASNTAANVYAITETLPVTAGGSIALTARNVLSITGPDTTGGLANGIAFGSQGDRRLYLANASSIRTVNPVTGVIEATSPLNGVATTGSTDLSSCASPNTIVGQASFPQGRQADTDQATLTISGGTTPVGAPGTVGTTTGTDTGVQTGVDETAGPRFGLDGQSYTVTQSGLANPQYYRTTYECVDRNTNAVLATGTGSAATFTMPPASGPNGTAAYCLFTNELLTPAITLDKRVTPGTTPGATPGSTISYQFVVTNSGNVTLSSVAVTDTKLPANPGVTCPAGALAPGASKTCTGTYTLTQADANAGTVVNTATVTGTPAVAGLASPTASDTNTVTVTRAPAVAITKTATPNRGADNRLNAGDTISYGFTVRNTGNLTLNNVAVTDPRIAGITCTPTSLAAGETATCTSTATYTVTQADVNNGSVANTATVTAAPVGGGSVTSSATVTTPTSDTKTVFFDKIAAAPFDANQDTVVGNAGDRITYTFLVRNTGDRTINGIAVTDPLVGTVSCATTSLAPGEQVVCTAAPHVITQAEVDAGSVNNTATLATNATNGPALSATDSTATATNANVTLELVKTAGTPTTAAGVAGRTDAGDTITYSFAVRNTGSLTLGAVAVTDAKIGAVACPAGSLAPNQTVTCTGTYTIGVADVNAAGVQNTATATAQRANGTTVTSNSSTASTPITQVRSIAVDKEIAGYTDLNTNGRVDTGDRLSYTFAATNTGSTTLTTVQVADAKVGTVTCPAGASSLAPGATVTCTADYLVTQADVNAGAVNNSATASGAPPTGARITSAPDTTSRPTADVSALTLVKSAAPYVDRNTNQRLDAGDTIAYSFAVSNTGSRTLTDVRVTDSRVGTVACPGASGVVGPALDGGQSLTCTATYTVLQSDVDAGQVVNTASVGGTNQAGTRTTSAPSTVTTTIAPVGTLALTKTLTPRTAANDVNGNGRVDVGDTVGYTFTLRNTGSVTLSAAAVSDPQVGPVTCQATTIAPNSAVTCSKTYTLTQADVNAGPNLVNQATATARTPAGATVTSNQSTATQPLDQTASLLLDKTASAVTEANGRAGTNPGDTITYSFSLTNTGSVTLGSLAVADARIGGGVTCAATSLTQGSSTTCTRTYALTQADLDAGAVTNTATASGTAPGGQAVPSNADSTTTPVATAATLTLTKTAGTPVQGSATGSSTSRVDAGDTVPYTFTVQNTGTVTLSGLAINDALVGAPVTTCATRTLAPGATTTCTLSYVLTQADVDAGQVVNRATATTTAPGGATVTSPQAQATVATSTANVVFFDKTAGALVDANNNARADVGETIPYTFLVRNDGAQTLRNVRVDDNRVATASCPAGPLAPGQSLTCTVSYVVTQPDIDAGSVVNTASATGTPPNAPAVTSAPDTTTTSLARAAALTLVKSATVSDSDGNGRTETGDVVNYRFEITNTGSVSFASVALSDPKVATLTCPTGGVAPGQTKVCTGTYTVTLADTDAGVVRNTASVTGTPSGGGATVTVASNTVETPTSRLGALVVDKNVSLPTGTDANNSGTRDAGDLLAFSFAVTNTGDTTLTNVTINDPLVTATCPGSTTAGNVVTGPSIAPGATVTCTATYAIRQADVDLGAANNTATATGTRPGQLGTVTSGPDSTTTPTSTTATLSIDKVAGTPVDVAGTGSGIGVGDTVPYTFVVTNTGVQNLTQVAVVDATLDAPGATCPATTLAPRAQTTCTGTHTITQADVAAGAVSNTATARGTRPNGATTTSPSDDTVTPIAPLTDLVLTKTAGTPSNTDGDNRVDAGDTVVYTFGVTNNSNVTLTGLTVTDPRVGVTCTATTLAANGGTTTCTSAPYPITQAQVDAGRVVNTARASGTAGGTTVQSNAATATLDVAPVRLIDLRKTAGAPVDTNANGRTDAGDTINYSFLATNTGTVTLDQLRVTDPKTGTVSCPVTTLAPGAETTCTVAYRITQADVDTGAVNNTATVSGTAPDGTRTTSPSRSTSTPLAGTAVVSLTKSVTAATDVNGNNRTDAGDTLTYRFRVTNEGSVSLTAVRIADLKIPSVTCPAGSIAPNAFVDCTAGYTITQADVDSGAVTNRATANTTTASGVPVSSTQVTNTYPTAAQSELTLVKSVDRVVDVNGNQRTDTGDRVDYRFAIANPGAVTVSNLRVVDALVDTVTCGGTASLAPGARVECTGSRTLTQADVNSRSVVNTATAVGNAPQGAVVSSPPSSTTTATSRLAALEIDKTAVVQETDGDPGTDAGDRIAYSFRITNVGDVTVNGVGVNDALTAGAACPVTTLAAGATVTCTRTYTITQDDVNAGGVTNTATASGTSAAPASAAVTSPSDSTTTPTTSTSTLALAKTAGTPSNPDGDNRLDAGDTIPYTFTVTNTGSTTLSTVTVQDDLTGPVACVASLAPGASATCQDSYVVTQDDVDRGQVLNTAFATATGRAGAPVRSADAQAQTPTSAVATLGLVKQASTPRDVNGNGRTDAGDTIDYTFRVTNTGAVSLTGVTVSDPKVTAVACPTGTLRPGDPARTCTASYTITQADVSSGAVLNRATVTGTSARGGAATPATASTSTPTTSVPEVDITLTGVATDTSGDGAIDARDAIVYTYDVTNTGTLPLTGVTVTDTRGATISCPATTLEPGATFQCRSTSPLTQDDLDAGQVLDEATVRGASPAGVVVTDTDPETTPLTGRASISLDTTVPAGVRDVDGNGPDAGDALDYVYRVTNTGTVSLSTVAVTATRGGTVTCEATTLNPGATTLCRNTYTLGQADLDAGTVTNTGTTTATTRTLGPVTATDPETTTLAAPGAITVTIDDGAGVLDRTTDGDSTGDTIDYTYVVTNTGPVTLTDVALTDTRGTAITCRPAAPLTLAPGASATCTGTTTLRQVDVDAGTVADEVTATGRPPRGAAVTDTDATSTPVRPTPVGRIAIDLTADPIIDLDGNGPDQGDSVRYRYALTNTGATTLSTVGVTDVLGTTISCTTDTLAPGATEVCTGIHLLTQAEVDRGRVVNTATTTGTTPTGVQVTDTDALSTTFAPNVATIDLTLTPSGAPDSAGDVIAYTYVATNTGPVTLTGVRVTDTLGNVLTCAPGTPVTLAPGASTTCTSAYPVTQTDVNAGAVTDEATATGTSATTGGAVRDTAAVTTPIASSGLVSIVLSAPGGVRDLDGNGPDAGDALDYVYSVTNDGTSTLSTVGVTDVLGTAITCPATTLEPGATLVCRGTHTLTQAEVDRREVANTATTTGRTPTGLLVQDTDTLTTALAPRAGVVEIDLSAAGGVVDLDANGPDQGDTITYSYVVRNVGTVSLTGVAVTDVLGDTVTCDATLVLAPGESTTCGQATYTLTRDDVNRGAVTNTATVVATDTAAGGQVRDTDVVTTAAAGRGTIDVVLDGVATDTTGDGRVGAGDTVVYTYRVLNTGTVTLSTIVVTDQLGTTVTCPSTTLDPGASILCRSTYPISQADVDRGQISNTATASGAQPNGQRVRDTDPDTTTLAPAASLTVTGTSSVDDLDGNGQDAGDTISYVYTVTNDGTQTVTSPRVVDAFGNTVVCTPTTLAPGASATCTSTGAYTLTQADLDARTVANAVTASATAGTATVTATGSVPTTLAPGGAVSIDLTAPAGIRDVDGNGPDAGDEVAYRYLVTNTGAVALSTLAVTDTLGDTVVCPTATLVPGGTTTCTATYVLTQADVDAGRVRDTATVTGTTPAGAPVTATDDLELPVQPRAGRLTVTGQGTVTDVDGNGQDAGDTVAFTYTVTNTTTSTVTGPTVTDGFGRTVTCTPATLAPGASATCAATTPYVLTQADVDAGIVTNPLTVAGTTPAGAVTGTGDADLALAAGGGIRVDLTAPNGIRDLDGNGPDAGDEIAFRYVVTNTGSVSLTAVRLTDSLGDAVTCPVAALAPGATTTCTSTYRLTQADVDAGSVTDTATVTGRTPAGVTVSDTDTVATPVVATPPGGLTVDVAAGPVVDVDNNGTDAGDTITSSYTVTNNGTTTLTGVGVSSSLPETVTCQATRLAPGASTTCTSTHVVTQAEIAAGTVTNTATARATTPSGGTVTSPDDTATTPLPTPGSLVVDATAGAVDDRDNDGIDAGDEITFTYVVTNDGPTTLTGVTVGSSLPETVTCQATTLAPGASTTCTLTHVLTPAELAAGAATDTATARGTTPAGAGVTSASDTASRQLPTGGDLTTDVTAGPVVDVDNNGTDVGDTITYTYTATNNAAGPLTGVVVSSSLPEGVTCTPAAPATLAAGASLTCTSTHVITQAEVDAGTVTNTATAQGTATDGSTVTAPASTETTPLPTTGDLVVDVVAGALTDPDGNGPDAGDEITYSYVVTNDGPTTLTGVTVGSSLPEGVTCPTTTLNPGQSITCTSTHVVTAAEVAAGEVVNTAGVRGQSPTGATVASPSDTTRTPVVAAPAEAGAVRIDKQAAAPVDVNGNSRVDAGDTVAYTFEVTNTGNVPLTDLAVNDPQVGPVTCPTATLAVGLATTCTVDYTITAADVAAGGIVNTATASGRTPSGVTSTSPSDTVTTTTTPVVAPGQPGLSVDKRASAPTDVDGDNRIGAGDAISYTFLVTNTGNTTVTGVAVDDALLPGVSCPATTLAAGGSTTCTATYTITQADVASGTVVNTATATGTAPGGAPVGSAADTVATPLPDREQVTVDVTNGPVVDTDGNGTDVGDTVTSTYTVTNAGTVPLSGVRVTSSLPDAVTCQATTLAPGASTTCTSTHVLTAADLAAGALSNTASASATTPSGATATSPADTATTPLPTPGSLLVDVTAGPVVDADSDGIDAGDEITFSYVVTNNGPTTLTGVTVGSSLPEAVTCRATTLAPGASTTCTSTHVVTAADLRAGQVVDTATASGTTPAGASVTSPSDAATTQLPTGGRLTVGATAGPVVDVDNNGTDVGDTITYTYVVTNNGTTPLTGVTVGSSLPEGVTCPSTTVAAGASITCTSTHVISQADLAAGTVTNTVTGTGTAPDQTTVTAPGSTETTPLPTPGALIVDVAAGPVVDADSNGTDAGDTVAYTYTVTNTGPTTLTGVTVASSLPEAVTCQATTLAPGASTTCTSTHAITAADLAAGSVTNTASAGATTPSGSTVTSPDDTAATQLPTGGRLAVTVAAGPVVDADNNGTDAGDTVAYTYTVTNTGLTALTGVAVGSSLPEGVTCPATTLAAGASITCTSTHVLTQAEVTAGTVANTATATGTAPDGTTVRATGNTATTPLPTPGSLVVDVSAGPVRDLDTNGTDAGDTIEHTYVVTNTGPTTLTGITLDSSLPEAVTCLATTLAPGASTTCTSTHVITAADLAAGSVTDTVTATGTTPAGATVTSPSDAATTQLPTGGRLTVGVTAGPVVDVDGNGTDVGDTVTYSYTATNNGTTPLTGVTVGSSLPEAVTCTPAAPATLAAGASITCTSTHVLTQAEVAAGTVANTATAQGTAPDGTSVRAPGNTVTTPLPTPGSVVVDVTAGPVRDVDDNGTDAGDEITYTYVVTNTGSTALTGVAVTSSLPEGVTCQATTLAPGAQTTCTSTHVLTAAEVDAGQVVNTATATGTTPAGATVTSPTDTATTPVVPVVVPISSATVDKRAGTPTDVNDNGAVDAGDTIDYTFTVTNTGTTRLTGVTVRDPRVPVTCPTATLAAGETMTCTATYTITAADARAGGLINSVSLTAIAPDGGVITPPTDTVVTPIAPQGLELDKRVRRVVDLDDSGTTNLGDAIVYEFVLTNSGGTALEGVSVTDPMLTRAGVDVTCPRSTLAVGASLTCVSARYLVTAADVAAGSVTNEATVTATTPDGQVVDGAGDTVVVPDVVGAAGGPGGGSGSGPVSPGKSGNGLTLPGTGTEVEPWMPIAAGLLLLTGLGLLVGSRRRRREEA